MLARHTDRMSRSLEFARRGIGHILDWCESLCAFSFDRLAREAENSKRDNRNIRSGRDVFKSNAVAGCSDERPILIVGKSGPLNSVSDWIFEDGHRFERMRSIDEAISCLQESGDRWSFVIVQLDDFGGAAAAIDALLLLRFACRESPVILVSADVSADDLSTERLMLCDVTLRLPLSVARFEVGIAEASINHGVWQDRKFQLLPNLDNGRSKSYAVGSSSAVAACTGPSV